MTKPYIIDFHGLTIKQSRQLFFWMVEKGQGIKKLSLVTGNGEIQKEIVRLLGDYSISWHFDGPNRGCIIVYMGMEDA